MKRRMFGGMIITTLVLGVLLGGCPNGGGDGDGGGTLTISGDCPTVNSILVLNTATVPTTQMELSNLMIGGPLAQSTDQASPFTLISSGGGIQKFNQSGNLRLHQDV
jgi:hypothetical protein